MYNHVYNHEYNDVYIFFEHNSSYRRKQVNSRYRIIFHRDPRKNILYYIIILII